jgi:sulfate permease, SulP family
VAALLIVAAVRSLKWAAILEVWRTNWAPRAIPLATLVLTLMVPIQYAVLAGVAISTIQSISSASPDVKVRRLVREGEGRYREEDPPERVPEREVAILDIYGSIFYAAADVIADKLPDVRDAKGTVLVLRLRGRGEVGSSAIRLLRRYATDLRDGGGALLLAGVGHNMADQLKRTGIEDLLGQHGIFPADSLVYASTEDAFEEGRRRLSTLESSN